MLLSRTALGKGKARMNWSLLPPACLAIGLAVGLFAPAALAPHKARISQVGKYILQASVVLIGFTIPLADIGQAGADGFRLALATIAGIIALGMLGARLLGTPWRLAALVSVGTAICGGSAIAALAPVVNAKSDEVAASLATVFLLNAIALFLFPVLGHSFSLTPEAFGQWAALAIHDTSSVVGAALAYSPESLPVATTVKLARALWIAPVCLAAALLMRKSTRARGIFAWIPWFIPGFLVTSATRDFLPIALVGALGVASKIGFGLALTCVGLGVNRLVFAKAGGRALALGVGLWVIAAVSTFLIVLKFPSN
jgi:uncharacterized integral membrane protein (TIGR00698 family)